MNDYRFTLAGARLALRPSGALWWAEAGLLAVSDLHLGKAARPTRHGGALLPPYETQDTLARLDAEIEATGPEVVICLGDSFDDLAAARELSEGAQAWLTRLMAGRRWIWIEGNHDPGPLALGGTHLAEVHAAPLTFRHIARPGARAEVSGHYHPKMRVAAGGHGISRPAMLHDEARVILPAFGTYTGGLRATDPALAALMGPGAVAVLTGTPPLPVPLSATPRRGGRG